MGLGYEFIITIASCRVPFSFAWTNPAAPSLMWHFTHATCACDPFCHAVNWGVIGVWHVCPQNDGDSIACRLPYPASRMMTTLTQVSARISSVARRTSRRRRSTTGHSTTAVGSRISLRRCSHIPAGISRRPSAKNAGIRTKTTIPAYGLSSRPASIASASVMKPTADTVASSAPKIATGCRTRTSRSRIAALLQAREIRDHRVDVGGGHAPVLLRHRRLLRGLRLCRRIGRIDDPVLDLVGAHLSADAVEGAGLAALAGNRVAHLALLGRIDFLSALG